MAEPYISQIGMFGGSFAPRGYAFCDGQLLSVSGNSALFSLIGTTYGGDGRTTFGLPDLRGRLPMHFGQGPGTSYRHQGAVFGTETVTLNTTQMPSHNHIFEASSQPATSTNPSGQVVAPGDVAGVDVFQFTLNPPGAEMNAQTLADTGGNQAHTNLMPLIAINFIIALQGVFPSRN